MSRRLIETMKLPAAPKPDPAVLAEALAEEFAVASIAGGHGEQELRFVTPGSLVVVVSATEVRFFAEPEAIAADAEDDGDEEGEEDEEQTPDDAADEISAYLAGFLGLSLDGEEEADADEAVPDDAADRHAARLVEELLARGLLELVTPRSRAQVEGRLAHLLAHGVRGAGSLAEAIADCSGVAELYADDAQMAEVLETTR